MMHDVMEDEDLSTWSFISFCLPSSWMEKNSIMKLILLLHTEVVMQSHYMQQKQLFSSQEIFHFPPNAHLKR